MLLASGIGTTAILMPSDRRPGCLTTVGSDERRWAAVTRRWAPDHVSNYPQGTASDLGAAPEPARSRRGWCFSLHVGPDTWAASLPSFPEAAAEGFVTLRRRQRHYRGDQSLPSCFQSAISLISFLRRYGPQSGGEHAPELAIGEAPAGDRQRESAL